MRHRLTIALSLLLAGQAVQGQPVDTIHVPKEKLFGVRDLVMAGGFTAATFALYRVDRHFAERFQDPSAQENKFLRGASTTVRSIAVPGALYIGGGMYVVGRVTKERHMADLGLHGTEAIIISGELGKLLKYIVGRARPNNDIENPHNFGFWRGSEGDHYRSFPSNHAVAAFAAASAVTSETTRWWPNSTWYVGTVMYGGAALVALSRMYDNKHWASDVMVGAAIGTFAGQKVVRWHHTHPKNPIDKILLRGTILPAPGGGTTVAFVFPTQW